MLRRLPDQVRLLGVPLYLGPSLSISRTENSLSGGSLPPGISASELDETHFGLGVRLQRDSRDDTFYPKQGSLADFEFQFFETALGSDLDYRVWDVAYRRFDELWPEGVLASRAEPHELSQRSRLGSGRLRVLFLDHRSFLAFERDAYVGSMDSDWVQSGSASADRPTQWVRGQRDR